MQEGKGNEMDIGWKVRKKTLMFAEDMILQEIPQDLQESSQN